MRICDRCEESDQNRIIHQVVIRQEESDLCTDCEQELGEIFLQFMKKGK